MKIDIYNINYDISSEKINYPPPLGPLRVGGIIRLLIYTKNFFKYLPKISFWFILSRYHNKMLFFACSKNQHDALSPIVCNVKDSIYTGLNGYGNKYFPIFFAYLLSLLFLPKVLVEYIKTNGYIKRTYKYRLDYYLLTYGYYFICSAFLKIMKPKLIILANDHSLYTRALLIVAKRQKIKTVYLQHASVTDKFPPLGFDYAFLDGHDALMKYNSAGYSDTKVFLTGFPKLDGEILNINQCTKVRSIGICLNYPYDKKYIEEFLGSFIVTFPNFKIIVRPHPGDTYFSYWQKYCEKMGVEFSDSRAESSFKLLRKVDMIISGESNIHLEAGMLNVYPVYFEMSKDVEHDYYGFIKNGLIRTHPQNYDELINNIGELSQSKPQIRKNAKFYYSTIDTAYDGKSTMLVAKLLEEITNNQINYEIWMRIENIEIQAFELK